MADRRAESAAYLREAARLAGLAGDSLLLSRALLNLADSVTRADPAAGAAAAREAAAHARQVGARDYLAFAVVNLAQALLMLGDWDTAAAELDQVAGADGVAHVGTLASYRAWVAALRGDVPAAQAALAGLDELWPSEDNQDQATIALVEAFTAAARHQPAAALGRARVALDYAATLGIGHECPRWAWALAARAAWDLADTEATAELLALLDSYRPGSSPPCCAPSATWPALASPPSATVRMTRAPRSPARSPDCASSPVPTTSPAACSTTPSGSPPAATRRGRGRDQRSHRHRRQARLPAAARPRRQPRPRGYAPSRLAVPPSIGKWHPETTLAHPPTGTAVQPVRAVLPAVRRRRRLQ